MIFDPGFVVDDVTYDRDANSERSSEFLVTKSLICSESSYFGDFSLINVRQRSPQGLSELLRCDRGVNSSVDKP
jgi:hypothetical protein